MLKTSALLYSVFLQQYCKSHQLPLLCIHIHNILTTYCTCQYLYMYRIVYTVWYGNGLAHGLPDPSALCLYTVYIIYTDRQIS